MAVIVNGDGILTGISSLTTSLTDITSGRGTVTGVATVGTLQLGTGVSISSPRSQTAAIFTNDTEFFTVDDAGRVGVGTITPNSDAHPENEKKINVGFITAKSIAGDIDARNVVVAGISTFVGALNATSVVSSGAVSGTTGTFSGDVSIAENIVHTGDTNTKISFPAADTIAAQTGGTERLRITSTGDVNIGGELTQTDSRVHIQDVTRPLQEGTLTLSSAATTDGAADNGSTLRFFGHDGSTNRYQSSIRGAKENGTSGNYAGYLAFNTRPNGSGMVERMRISSEGKVTIGTIGTTATDTGLALLDKNLTAESDASDTANYHLVIRSQSNTNTSKVGIAFKNTSDSTPVGAAILHHRTAGGSVGDLAFYTSPSSGTTTERVRITSTGTTLIGSGAFATQKASNGGLDVSCNTHSIVFGADSNSGNLTQARTNNAIKDSRMGCVHYTNAEEVVGVVRAYSDSSTNKLYFGGGSSLFNAATEIQFYTAANNTTTNGTERIRIHAGGTVSIPTGVELGSGVDGTSANTLDDYEEGSFTPVVYYDSTNNHTYSEQIGLYTKIGNFVYGTMNLTWDDQASTGQVGFSLPFTSANVTGTRTSGYFIYQDGLNIPSGQGSTHLILYGGQNSSSFYAYFAGGTNNSELGTSATQLTHSHTSTGNTVRIAFHYRTG